MKTLLLALGILCFWGLGEEVLATMTCPVASCKYVRPARDWNEVDLNYGTEDGSTEATAFDGFSAITGLVAGDTVCLPGSDEPFTAGEAAGDFFDTNVDGTASAPITYVGCGTDPALIFWSSNLTGDRSYDASRLLVTGDATYEWESMGNDFYKKKIGVRALVLWEDNTYLVPVASGTDSEATIMGYLAPGQWTNRDNGDSTFRIIYKSTSASKSPSTTTIRSNNIPRNATGNPLMRIDKSYIVFRNLLIKGYSTTSGSSSTIRMQNGGHALLEDVTIRDSRDCMAIEGSTVVNDGTTLRRVHCLNNGTGIIGNPNTSDPTTQTVRMKHLTFEGGEYSGSTGSYYNGTTLVALDGDGIGIGFNGGVIEDVVITGIIANDNLNRGVFSGTTSAGYFLDRFALLGASMNNNGRGCFSEGTDFEIRGTLLISGLVCTGTRNVQVSGNNYAAIHISQSHPANAPGGTPAQTTRDVIIVNSSFVGNASKTRIEFEAQANNHMVLRNLVFADNPGWPDEDLGDIGTASRALGGAEIFDNLYFYSLPNLNRRFATIGAGPTAYVYNSGTDLADFNTATGATHTVLNTDPSVRADGRTNGGSVLRRAGTPSPYCIDYRARPCWAPPDIGGVQATAGDAR